MSPAVRRAAAVLAVAVSALSLALLALSPVHAATAPKPTYTLTYTPSKAATLIPPAAGTNASVATPTPPKGGSILAGQTIEFVNSDTTDPVTISSTSKNWTFSVKLAKAKAAGSTSAPIDIPAAGTFTYQAVGTNNNGTASGTATGSFKAGAAPSTPAASPSTSSSVAGSSTPAASSSPSASPSTSGSLTATPGLVGGVIPSVAPSGASTDDGLPPQVAPYSITTPTPTSSPSASSSSSAPATTVFHAGGSSGGGDRSLGLPAAVAGVAVIGLLATIGKVLLAHPAARAVARRH